jgi:hypothetical protein
MTGKGHSTPPEKMLGVLKRLEASGKHLLGLINDAVIALQLVLQL